jgi:hypothetical protein
MSKHYEILYHNIYNFSCESVKCCGQALAKESGANFICLRPSMLQSKWYGETQKLVQATFTLAYKLQPCIIFVGAQLPPADCPSRIRSMKTAFQMFQRSPKR